MGTIITLCSRAYQLKKEKRLRKLLGMLALTLALVSPALAAWVSPGTNVIGVDNGGNFVTLATIYDPEWNWGSQVLSYTYVAPSSVTSDSSFLGHSWTVTWDWTAGSTMSSAGGTSGLVIGCFVAMNDGTIWYNVPSTNAFYGNGGTTCYYPSVAPSNWFNSAGQSAANDSGAWANLGNASNIFGVGFIFGNNRNNTGQCGTNWFSSANPGNPYCWTAGISAANSHFAYTSASFN